MLVDYRLITEIKATLKFYLSLGNNRYFDMIQQKMVFKQEIPIFHQLEVCDKFSKLSHKELGSASYGRLQSKYKNNIAIFNLWYLWFRYIPINMHMPYLLATFIYRFSQPSFPQTQNSPLPILLKPHLLSIWVKCKTSLRKYIRGSNIRLTMRCFWKSLRIALWSPCTVLCKLQWIPFLRNCNIVGWNLIFLQPSIIFLKHVLSPSCHIKN